MRKTLFAGLALVLSASVASAQAVAPELGTVTFLGDISDNGSVNGINVGPYQAKISGFAPLLSESEKTVNIWCVDWSHVANYSPDTYFATAFPSNSAGVSGTDFSDTRQYTAASGNAAAKNATAQTKYTQAAWLIEQYLAGRTNFTAVNVQGTIWNLMGANLTSGFTELAIAKDITLQYNWFVLSDDNAECTGYAGKTCSSWEQSSQEYLTYTPRSTVPEPSTYALMAAGLAGIGMAARRRRRVNA